MVEWKKLFSRTILDRGKSCHSGGEVVGLHTEEGISYAAMLVGSELYRTSVTIRGGEIADLQCNCPFFRQPGIRCKHQAALLYAVEARAGAIMRDDEKSAARIAADCTAEEAEEFLRLAIDCKSLRCTAILLDRRAGGESIYSPDTFTLDDLPEDPFGPRPGEAAQGDNDPLRMLFGAETVRALRRQMEEDARQA